MSVKPFNLHRPKSKDKSHRGRDIGTTLVRTDDGRLVTAVVYQTRCGVQIAVS